MRTRKHAAETTAALVLALALGSPGLQAQQTGAAKEPPTSARTIEVKILGMSCPFCAYGVQKKLEALDGVETLQVDLESGIATLEMADGADLTNARLVQTVEDAGFEVATIRRSFESEHPDYPADPPGAGQGSEGAAR